jgi:hypothetical protein
MSSPNPDELRKTLAEQKKLELEIETLEREQKWYWMIGKLPVVTTLIAAAGIIVTVWQIQRTELAQIEERKARIASEQYDRINRIQTQIRADKELLGNFESDPKMSSVQARFLIDDLASLTRQLPANTPEEETIAEHLRGIVWSLPFNDKKDFDFDVSTLSHWMANRVFWRVNSSAHHIFLERKYYPEVSDLRSCFGQLTIRGAIIDYGNMPKGCNKELVGAIIYGFGEHLRVAKESSEAALDSEVEQFVRSSQNGGLGDELRKQALPQN